AWPALVVHSDTRAVVVGPDRVLLEHALSPQVRSNWWGPRIRYVDGDLCVRWWGDKGHTAYWASRPEETFTPEDPDAGYPPAPPPAHPAGGRASGGRLVHAGDTTFPRTRSVVTDGTSWWTAGEVDNRPAWLEYDPPTGATGRASLPAFFADAVGDGGRLDVP